MDKLKLYIDKSIQLALFLVSVTFPLSFKISNLAIGLLVITWVLRKLLFREKISFKLNGQFSKACVIAFLGLFLLQVFSLLYTDNLNLGLKFLEYKLSFLILPLIISDIEITKVQVINQLKYFAYSITFFSILLLANSGVNYITNGELLTYHSFTETDSLLDVHAVFYSYFIFFSILILTYFYRNGMGIKNKYLIALMYLPLVVAIVFAASKNVMVITFVTIVLYLFFILIKEIRWKQLVLVGVGLILAIFMVAKLPMVKNRIVELSDFSGIENYEKIINREKLTAPEREALNGTSLRLAFWYIGITEVFDHERILLGLSPGDSKALLNFRYDELNLLPFLENYNMHNQFVQMFVEFGVVGLIFYLCLITLLILASIKNRNLLMLIFVVGFLFFQLSESLLERNKGILFFVFFLLLLLKLNIKKENENSNSWD